MLLRILVFSVGKGAYLLARNLENIVAIEERLSQALAGRF